jgi:D-hexose-6-phosphate mutarotase
MAEHPLHRFFLAAAEAGVRLGALPAARCADHRPPCQAVFSRQGAQLLHFQPTGEKPWLWCAEQWPQVGAIRGGVPVCWPWYGRHQRKPVAVPWLGAAARLEAAGQPQDEEGVTNWQLDLCDWQVDLHAHLGAAWN